MLHYRMAASDAFGGKILLTLAILALCGGGALVYQQSLTPADDLTARIIRTTESPKGWKIFEEPHAHSGATIPPNMNVVFRLPTDMETTTREVLLGQKGKTVRYWGYCFGENFTEETVTDRVERGQLPGRIFLSEAERAVRDAEYKKSLDRFSVRNPPTSVDDLAKASAPNPSPVQHQIDVFEPGMICYIQTSEPLGFGIDSDNDLLNNKLERELGTKIDTPDTDEDGITDGVEVLSGTLPKVRDSDGDGLIDGLEDKNWNGRIDAGETNAQSKDSDKDGLCDGVCRMKFARGKEVFIGEDLNLDGLVSSGETSPIQWSTRKDGTSDYQAYLNCQLGDKKFCTK